MNKRKKTGSKTNSTKSMSFRAESPYGPRPEYCEGAVNEMGNPEKEPGPHPGLKEPMESAKTIAPALDSPILTPSAVCSIIEACAKANVFELQFQGLLLKFGPSVQVNHRPPAQELQPTTPSEAALSEQHEKQTQETLELDEARLKDDQLALMRIENPVAYEQLVLSGELEEDEEGLDGDDDSDA